MRGRDILSVSVLTVHFALFFFGMRLRRALRDCSCGSRGFLEDRMMDMITGRAPARNDQSFFVFFFRHSGHPSYQCRHAYCHSESEYAGILGTAQYPTAG